MKQFQLFYTSRNTFRPEFAAIRDACPDGKFMEQVFYENARKAEAAELAALLDAAGQPARCRGRRASHASMEQRPSVEL